MSVKIDADMECTFDECMALERKEQDVLGKMGNHEPNLYGRPHEVRAARYRVLARVYAEAAVVADERAAWRDRCYRFGL